MRPSSPLTQVHLARYVFLSAAAATFAMAVIVGTGSLSVVPHPAFLHGFVHEGDHDALHFWSD